MGLKNWRRQSAQRRSQAQTLTILRLTIVIFVLLMLLFAACLYIFPQFKFALGFGDLPTSIDDMRADKVMGYKTAEIRKSVLGECEAVSRYVVMEQDIEVTLDITQQTLNIPLLKKVQTIYAYGKGAFGVDLSLIDENDIIVNNNIRTVEVTIPRTQLLYVTQDHEATQFSEVDHQGLFSFGDIKLTPEQNAIVQLQIDEAMHERLHSVFLTQKADGLAQEAIRTLFEPLMEKGYRLAVRFAD